MRVEPWFLELVFLVYGLSFVVIGVAILAQPMRQSRFDVARILWLFAVYALLHAPADFVDLLAIRNDVSKVARLGTLLTYASYGFLFEFGRRLWGLTRRTLPWWILPILAAAVFAGSALSPEPWATGHALVGYLIRVPAGLLAGIGFLSYSRPRRWSFVVAGSALLAWAFFCGMVRERAPFFPANVLNLTSFAATVGVPVHLFRAACALAAATAIGAMLKVSFRETVRTVENALEDRLILQEAIKSASDPLIVVGPDGTLATANDRALALSGYGEAGLVGRKLDDFLVVFTDRGLWRSRSGERIPVSVSASEMRDPSGRPLGQVVILRDLREKERMESELRRAQQELLQAQKLEAVGRLAGGIAHDFHNTLQVIQSSAESMPDGEAARDVLAVCERSAALTRQLLLFSRKTPPDLFVFDLNDAVRSTLKFLGRVLGDRIAVRVELSEPRSLIRGDRNHVEQAIVNLGVNARDAMPEGGTLTIGTERSAETVLTVRDTGVGMDETVLAHLFEPFFTTKEPGKGTGLGLAMVHGVVKESAGTISVDSKPGRGTTFRIAFPSVEDVKAPARTDVLEEAPPKGNGETILVVEDGAEVRRGIRRSLESGNYRVIEASDGAEALSLWPGLDPKPHLVVTDLTMPGMTGAELARNLRRSDARCRLLYISGRPDVAEVSRDEVLLKPFDRATLLRRVGRALATDSADPMGCADRRRS